MPIFNLKSLKLACAVVGANITVVGNVVNSNAVVSSDITAADTPGTGISPTSCTVNSTGNTMTQSISVSGVLSSFGDALKYTGMTTSATFYAVAPAVGTLAESTETVTSTGQFWATLSSNSSTNNHLFRSVGIAGDEYVPSTAPSTVATWGGNPQRVLIDTTTFGGSPVNITVGQSITCSTGSNITVGATAGIGLIDYSLGYARLLIFPTSVCTVNGTVATTTSAQADSTHFHIATLDLYRFYSTTGATSGSVATSATAYSRRLNKAALAIVNSLGEPDILSVQEVQDLATLTDLATATNALGSTNYQPYLVQGNDPNSLNLGFLVNKSTVVVDSVSQLEASSTYTTATGGSATLWERPPLILQAEFVRTGKNYPVTVINEHLTPRDNIDDSTLGPDIRQHRAVQAGDLSALIQSYQTAGANVLVAGNLNAFEFSDGYVDVTGILNGAPAAASAVTLYQATNTTAILTDFAASVSSTSRYNYIERGDAVVYEHIMASATIPDNSTASASLASYVSAVTQPHFTTDFAAIDENDSTTPAGLTPHDGFVVAFLIPPAPTTASLSPTAINFGNIELGASANHTVTFTNTTTFTSTVNVTSITISGTNATDFSQISNCVAVSMGQSCTITVTFSPTAIGARSATLTLASDSTSDPSLTVSLSGTGINTTATLSPSSATFPSTELGATSATQTFTFMNTSTQVSEFVSSTVVTGDFSIVSNSCVSQSVAPGGTCTVTVSFIPTVVGTRTGTLTLTNSSTANGTLVASLTGTGIDTTATLTPTSLTFAPTDIGGISASQALTFTNTSTDVAVSVTNISISGDFAIASNGCLGKTVAPGGTCTISVNFVPTITGARTGTVTLTNSSTGNPTLTASLNGTGLDTTATLTPANATFGSVYAGGGSSGAQIFTLTNTSAIAITVKTIALSSSNFTQNSTTCGTTLNAGTSCTISVSFTPQSSGVIAGALTITDSTTANPTLVSTLSGVGLPTTATISPSLLSFPNTIVGITSTPLSITWSNTSAIALTIKSIVPNGDFSISSTTCSGSIAANSSCLVYVAFQPTVLGVRSGSVTINSTASANPSLTAALSGRGVADVEANLNALDFGNVDLGSTSAAQTITITNYTNASIAFTSLVLSGSDYADTTTCGSVLAGLSSCTATITFTPSALGTRTGTFTVNTNDTKYPVITVSLTGNGVDFALAMSPTSGSIIAGFYETVNLALAPEGGFNSALTISCSTNAPGSECDLGSSALTLSSAATIPLKITTTSQYVVIGYSGLAEGWLALGSAFMAVLFFLKRPRTLAIRLLLLPVLLAFGMISLSGCGTTPARNSVVTEPGTYTYTVSATDGTVVHSTTYTLTVTAN